MEGARLRTALVAEDEATTMMYLRRVLVRAGIRVIGVANTGLEAVRQALDHEPDIIFMDIDMPLMNGIEATRRIRASRSEYDPCIIMCTAHNDPTHRAAAAEAGAKGYVLKPYNAAMLMEQLTSLCPGEQNGNQTPDRNV